MTDGFAVIAGRGWWLVIGIGNAIWLALVRIAFSGVLGIGAGGITWAVLRRSWSLRGAAIDGLLAIAVAGATAYVLTTIATSLGIYRSLILPIWAVAVASVVIRHLVRRRQLRSQIAV
jgi:hypothetical protein